MGHKFYVLKDTLASGSNFGNLQLDGAPPVTAVMTDTGWGVPSGTNYYSPLIYEEINTSFGSTPLPVSGGPPDNTTGDSFRSANILYTIFANSAWTLNLAGSVSGVTGGGNARMRVYRSTSATGAGATEITSNPITFPQWGIGPQTLGGTFNVQNGLATINTQHNQVGIVFPGDYLVFTLTLGTSKPYKVSTVSSTTVTLTSNYTDTTDSTSSATDYGPMQGGTVLSGTFALVFNSTNVFTSTSQVGIVNVGDLVWFGSETNGTYGANPTFTITGVSATALTLGTAWGNLSVTSSLAADFSWGTTTNLTGTFNVTNGSPNVTAITSQTGLIFPNDNVVFYTGSFTSKLYSVLSVSGTAIVLSSNYTDTSSTTADANDYGPLAGATLTGTFTVTHGSANVTTSTSQVGNVNPGDTLWIATVYDFDLFTVTVSSVTATDIVLTSTWLASPSTTTALFVRDLGSFPVTEFTASTTWSPGPVTLTNEYLFFQLAFYSTNTGANDGVLLVQDGANSVIETPGYAVYYGDVIEGTATITDKIAVKRTYQDAMSGSAVMTDALVVARRFKDSIVGHGAMTDALGVTRGFLDSIHGQSALTDNIIVQRALADAFTGQVNFHSQADVLREFESAMMGAADLDLEFGPFRGFMMAIEGVSTLSNIPFHVIRRFLDNFVGQANLVFPLADRRLPIQGSATFICPLSVTRGMNMPIAGFGSMTDMLGKLVGFLAPFEGGADLGLFFGPIRGFTLTVEGQASASILLTVLVQFVFAVTGQAVIPYLQMGVIRVLTNVNEVLYLWSLSIETGVISVEIVTQVDETASTTTLPIVL